jgi:hypothetical protein
MRDFLKESWEEYIGFFKHIKKDKKKLIFFVVVFELAIFLITAYGVINFFKD